MYNYIYIYSYIYMTYYTSILFKNNFRCFSNRIIYIRKYFRKDLREYFRQMRHSASTFAKTSASDYLRYRLPQRLPESPAPPPMLWRYFCDACSKVFAEVFPNVSRTQRRSRKYGTLLYLLYAEVVPSQCLKNIFKYISINVYINI